jgi:hypothetical protein
MIALDLLTEPIPKRDVYIAPWPVELVSTMPAPTYQATAARPRYFTRIAQVMVPDCQPGDLLEVLATFQVSNRLPDIAEFSSSLVLTPDATGVAGIADPTIVSGPAQPPRGKYMKRFPGFNVTPNATANFPNGGMHHAPAHLNCRYIVPDDVSGDQYVIIVAYAASTGYESWRSVFVDGMCGDLSVARTR